MHLGRTCLSVIGVCVCALALSSTAFAQRTSGDITGTVTDGTGGVLPGVNVTAVCTETSLTRSSVTDSQGGFRLSELPICIYKVTAELSGFKTVTRDAQVFVNAVAKADFKLEVGVQSETITVQGVSPLIEFSDELNSRIDAKRAEEIPLSGRDFNSLLNVIPGRAASAGRRLPGCQRQRRSHLIEQLHDRRHLEQRSLLRRLGDESDRCGRRARDARPRGCDRRLHRAADAVRGIRRQRRRRDQHRHEERRQRAAWHRLLLPS